MPTTATATPGSKLLTPKDHALLLIDFQGQMAFATHSIDPMTLRADDFDAFIESRRKLLINQIGKAMGKPVIATGEPVADDDAEQAAGATA